MGFGLALVFCYIAGMLLLLPLWMHLICRACDVELFYVGQIPTVALSVLYVEWLAIFLYVPIMMFVQGVLSALIAVVIGAVCSSLLLKAALYRIKKRSLLAQCGA